MESFSTVARMAGDLDAMEGRDWGENAATTAMLATTAITQSDRNMLFFFFLLDK
jgi:hypothetical protein